MSTKEPTNRRVNQPLYHRYPSESQCLCSTSSNPHSFHRPRLFLVPCLHKMTRLLPPPSPPLSLSLHRLFSQSQRSHLPTNPTSLLQKELPAVPHPSHSRDTPLETRTSFDDPPHTKKKRNVHPNPLPPPRTLRLPRENPHPQMPKFPPRGPLHVGRTHLRRRAR